MIEIDREEYILPDLTSQISERLSADLIRKRDGLILKVVSRIAGRELSVIDLVGRCELICLPTGEEIFKFDGMPLIEFYKFKVDHEDDGFSKKAVIKQQFRILDSRGLDND